MYLLGGVGRVGAVVFQHLDTFLAAELHSGDWVECIPADSVCARYISWLLEVVDATVAVSPRQIGAALKTRPEHVLVSQCARAPAFYKLYTDPVAMAAALTFDESGPAVQSVATVPPVRVHKSTTVLTHQQSLPSLDKSLKAPLSKD